MTIYMQVDALGFTYTEDFSVELAVKPGKQQQAYAGLFGDHNCGGHQYTGMVMQQIGRQTSASIAMLLLMLLLLLL